MPGFTGRAAGPVIALRTKPLPGSGDMSGESDSPGHSGQEAGKGFAAQVVGNTSLLTAVLVYTGWAYENALLKHFNVTAFSLGISTVEYALKGLVPVFQSLSS
jgi:hypothetical protein